MQFDSLTRSIGTATSRRTALQGLAVGLLGLAGLGAIQSESEARSRKRRRRSGSGFRNCGAQYAGCNSGDACCQGLICQELRNPSVEAVFSGTCAYRRGCGRRNDFCETNRDCCRRFRCRGRQCKRRPNS